MIEELWEEYSKNRSPETRDELIMACLPYVKSSAYRLVMYANSAQDVNDLTNAGIIGLMDAVERYDPTKGASFKNYSSYRIRGSIMDEIRSMDWVPYSTRDKARKVGKAMQELGQDTDQMPDDDKMAVAMGMSLEKYHETLLEVNRMTLSLLDDTFHNGEASGDRGSMSTQDPESETVKSEITDMVGDAIENLPKKERLVITLYYYEEMTMKEIGQVLDISESRVCQIHSSAILRLHGRLKCVSADVSV